MRLVITVLEGSDKNKQSIFIDFPISIGRLTDNDFHLNDKYVSRRHCTIYSDGISLTVSDLSSTNKTILNKIVINEPKPIFNEDELIIGRNLLKILIK